MEEKSKEVKKGKQAPEKNTQEKLTYEQLEQIAGNLQAQCGQLHNQLRNAQSIISEFNEIGMLLEILGKSEHFSEDFVTRCSKMIEEIVTKALDDAEKAGDKSGGN